MPSLYQSISSASHPQSKSLRTQSLTLLLCIFFVGVSWGQVTIFSENMGSPSGTTTIAANIFQNTSPISFAGTCDVRNTSPSSTYTGSSGGGNVFFGTSGGNAKELIISGINSSNFSSIVLSFGINSTVANSMISVECSEDGITYTALSVNSTIVANTWTLKTATGTIPAASNLRLKFSKNSTTQYRIDDVKLTGVQSTPTITGSATTSAFTSTYGSASTAQSFSISGSNLTANLVATAPTGFEVSADGTSYGTTATFSQTGGNASGTLYIRLSALAAVGSYNSKNIVLSSTGATSVNITTPSTGNAVTCTNVAWIGGTSGNWNNTSNWCGGSVPTSASNVTIPSGVSVTLDAASTTIADLTINGTLTVAAANQLTVTGTLTNSGTLTLENGATLVQTGSNANAGSGGTYNVKQVISGSNSGGAPNGRGWYMGSPVSGATSDLFAPSNSTNLIYHWNANQTTPSWAQHAAGSASNLEVGKGYAVRIGETSPTITFSSSTLNNAPTPIAIPCYKQASTTYQGYNLVSNPFASYLDWDDAWTGTNASNFESTIYYRVANGSNVMVFDTYNAQNGQGTSNSTAGSYATRYIPPMQAFWVKMASSVSASTSAVNLSFSNSMRDHYTSVVNGWSAGLKTTAQDFPMFLRLNLEQGSFKDQMLVFLKQQASSQYDGYDSEKMFLAGYPQIYTQIGNRKLVFNGLNSHKKITVIPVTIEIPNAGLFTLRAEEFNVEDGLILLVDKQEGITQDLTNNDAYTFYADAGTLNNRFFIRFHQLDPTISAQGPSNSWAESETEIAEGGSIVVATNGRGKVTIQQDIDPMASCESKVFIHDAAGREVLCGTLSGIESVFQLDVPSGIYFVQVQLNGQVEVKKIFVQQ